MYTGSAPGAPLIIVNGWNSTAGGYLNPGIIAGMDFIFTAADTLGLPAVINMSLGKVLGAHDGSDVMEQAIDFLTGPGIPGRAFVVAAGNSGHKEIHAEGDLNDGPQKVDLFIPPGSFIAVIDVWYDGSDSFLVDIVAPVLGPLGLNVPPGFDTGPICEPLANVCAHVIHSDTQAANSSKEISIVVFSADGQNPIGVPGEWSFVLSDLPSATAINNGRFDAWCALCTFTSQHGNTDMTAGAPSTSHYGLTVGASVTRACGVSVVGLACDPFAAPVGGLTVFSSHGPTRDGRIKPDIVAPGSLLVSALSKDALGIFDFQIHPSGTHVGFQGTSMASPITAGAVALLLSLDPTLDAVQIKDILQANAVKDVFTGPDCNNLWGCGKLNLFDVPPLVDLSIEKLAAPDPVVAGELLVYQIVVTNNGPSDATGVQVIDMPPADTIPVGSAIGTSDEPSECDVGYDPFLLQATVFCEIGDLPAGASQVIFIGIGVLPTMPNGPIWNQASVSSIQHEIDPLDNQAFVATEVVAQGYIGPVLIHPAVPDQVVGGNRAPSAMLALDLPLLLGGDDANVAEHEETQSLAGAQFDLLYDPSLFEVLDVYPGFGIDDCAWSANPSVPGVISMAFACAAGRGGNPLDTLLIDFHAYDVSEPTTTGFLVENVFLGDDQAQQIEGLGGGQEFQIIPQICGDVTLDGDVDILDGILGSQIIVGQVEASFAQGILGDLDGDGQATVLDLIQALQFIVGNVDELHCGSYFYGP